MMLHQYNLANKDEMERWDSFVSSHPDATPFHRSCWLRTLEKTYSFDPLLYVYTGDGTGELGGIFPLFRIRSLLTGTRVVSLPFSDFGGPLCNGSCLKDDMVAQILQKFNRSVKYVEIRDDITGSAGFSCHNHYKRHVLTLSSDVGEVLKKIDKKTIQYSIRKARKSGVEIVEESNRFGTEEFYRLNCLTRKKHGVPVQPIKFFEKLHEYIFSSGNGYLLLASCNGQVMAAGIFLTCRDTVYYKYSSSDPAYLTEKCPNHLLTMHAIERACLAGYRFFDFGRTSPDNEGLIRYKEMWGAQSQDLPYYFYPHIKGATATEGEGKSYQLVTRIWRLLPDSITDIIGPMLFRHIG
jgi:CelD/BcsL family acetyltransferase involved in cellulose biosynthesis